LPLAAVCKVVEEALILLKHLMLEPAGVGETPLAGAPPQIMEDSAGSTPLAVAHASAVGLLHLSVVHNTMSEMDAGAEPTLEREGKPP
jgi:hypothetical protein